MPVTKHVSNDGRQVRIVVTDSFDEKAHDVFKSTFFETADTCEAYEVDLSGVTRMFSAGLGLLILLRDSAASINASVKIINPSTSAKRNLELAFLHRMLDICFDPAI